MLSRLKALRTRQSVIESKRAAQEAASAAEHQAQLKDLEKDLANYVDQMRARWRRSMTPRPAVPVKAAARLAKPAAA